MPTRTSARIGSPCRVDLMTFDTQRNQAVDGQLFGWTAEDPAQEFGGYFHSTKDGVRVAGCVAEPARRAPTRRGHIGARVDLPGLG